VHTLALVVTSCLVRRLANGRPSLITAFLTPETTWGIRWPPYQPGTGQTRARREDHKQRIVNERGYPDLRLNGEDVAEFDDGPASAPAPTGPSQSARTSAGSR
jgi:hypothetical protein